MSDRAAESPPGWIIAPKTVVVEIVHGPDVISRSVGLEMGTVTARIPSTSGGTVIAGTIECGTVAAPVEIVGAVELAARVHAGAVAPADAARLLGRSP